MKVQWQEQERYNLDVPEQKPTGRIAKVNLTTYRQTRLEMPWSDIEDTSDLGRIQATDTAENVARGYSLPGKPVDDGWTGEFDDDASGFSTRNNYLDRR